MGVERLEVLVRHPATGHEEKRQWTKPELMKSMAWLKRMNARGHNVYVQPSGQHALILFSGVNPAQLVTMMEKELVPAIVVEIAINSFQAWVKLSTRPLPEPIRQAVSERLTNTLGKGLRPEQQAFGFLAGFTINDAVVSGSELPRFARTGPKHAGISPLAAKHIEQIETTIRARLKTVKRWGRNH